MDSILIYALSMEIRKKLVGKRVNKLIKYKKSKFELKFSSENLLLCASPSNSYFYLNGENEEPQEKSIFSDLFEKYVKFAILDKIEQYNLERILKFYFTKKDRFETVETKSILIFELIGRQSNLILTDETETIISCLRPFSKQGAPRELIQGVKYQLPEPMGEKSVMNIEKTEFNALMEQYSGKSIKRGMLDIISDISPQMTKEVIFRASLNPTQPIDTMDSSDRHELFKQLMNVKEIVDNSDFQPTIIYKNSNQLQSILPINPDRIPDDKKKQFERVNAACREFYQTLSTQNRMKSLRNLVLNGLERRIKRTERRLQKQKKELESANRWQDYKLYGELINANLHKIKKGQKTVKLPNYYDPNMKAVEIPLDPTLSPQENAERYFTEYKKSKRGKEAIEKQIQYNKNKLDKLSTWKSKIVGSQSLSELKKIKEKFLELGYLQKPKTPSADEEEAGINPYEFTTSEGWTVLIGKNKKENDYLTLYIAKKDDLWFHVQGATGSHVILKREGKKKQISRKTIYEVASLAAGYSSAKHSTKVPVMYTEKRYVRKPKGAPPGAVVCKNEKSIWVKPTRKI